MSKLVISSIVLSIIICTGCSNSRSTKNHPLVARYDKEAAKLGFPQKFFPKEPAITDWSQAHRETISNVEVEVVDGPVVEVCGGCDK